jgi:hypothetical protein
MFIFVSLFFVLGVEPSSEALPFFSLIFDFMFILLQYMFDQHCVPFEICHIFSKYDTHRRNLGGVRGQMPLQYFCYLRIVFFFATERKRSK